MRSSISGILRISLLWSVPLFARMRPFSQLTLWKTLQLNAARLQPHTPVRARCVGCASISPSTIASAQDSRLDWPPPTRRIVRAILPRKGLSAAESPNRIGWVPGSDESPQHAGEKSQAAEVPLGASASGARIHPSSSANNSDARRSPIFEAPHIGGRRPDTPRPRTHCAPEAKEMANHN
jgi:hypothetical protein